LERPRFIAVERPSPDFADSPALLWLPLTVGVGHNEDPFTLVRAARVGRREPGPDHLVTELAEAGDNDIQAPPNRSRNVLPDDEGGPELGDDAEHVEPESGPSSAESSPSSGEAEVLAWGSSADDIDARQHGRVSCNMLEILVPNRVRPMARQYRAAVGVDFNLPARRS